MTDTSAPPPPAEGAGFLLWRAANAWQRSVRVALEPLGITHAQYILLATLRWIGGSGAKQHLVAELAGMDPMTVSQISRSLEERGLVRREPHPEDGRAYLLALSPRGRRMVARAAPALGRAEAAFFARAEAAAGGRTHRSVVAALRLLVGGS